MLAVWMVLNYLSNDTSFSLTVSLWLKRAAFFMPPIGLYFLLLFSLLFTRIAKKTKAVSTIIGLSAICMAFFSVSDNVLRGIYHENGIVVNDFGDHTLVYLIYLVALVLFEIWILVRSLKKLRGQARARIIYMAAGLFASLVIMVITNLVLPLYAGNYSLAVFGLLSTILIVSSFSYAIVKLRLFDIRIVVARSITYSMLLLSLAAMYAIMTFQVGGAIFNTTAPDATQQTFNIATAIILAFTFQPLQHFFEKLTDKFFYRNRYEPRKLVDKITQITSTEIDLGKLCKRVRLLLNREMHLDYTTIVVLEENKVFTESGHFVVSELQGLAEDLAHFNNPLLVTDELPDGKRKTLLMKYEIDMFTLLKTREGRVGYLLLGHKLNGDIFNTTDVEVINTISKQLAVAIENAKSYAKVQRFNSTLQAKVDEATKQLRDAYSTLKKLDKVKDEFLSMASHQLRTPLTISDGFLGNVIDGAYGKVKDKQLNALKISQSHLHITIGIVSDLLNISRMDVGKLTINYESTDLYKIVTEEVGHLQTKAKEHNVKLELAKPKRDIPIVKIDRQKTQQAILNLISNAISYSPKGKVKVSIEHAGNQIIFRVDDNGIGVPDSDKDQMFTKFFRAENAKLSRPDGTGIGLYLVKRVIEDQGGSIIFESKENKGSTFGFRLPTNEEDKYVVK